MAASDNSSEEITRLVNERLEFVDMISGLERQFYDPQHVRSTPEGGWTHPWKYFDALRNYLLLTCFDLLGQPASYKDSQSWLSSDSSADERAKVELTLPTVENAFAAARSIHREYLKLYGTRRNNRLPSFGT